jgi:NAD(P)-dependent dehydrogenase (short-subunit alcohol dehydrogenase family)
MNMNQAVVLVTGANRGLGKALVAQSLRRARATFMLAPVTLRSSGK